MNRRAFSLIELLVVIAIVAVLAGLLLPAVGMVKNSARSTTCMMGMRQIGMAFSAYASDWNGQYPGKYASNVYEGTPYKAWFGGLLDYLQDDVRFQGSKGVSSKAYICPDGSDPFRSLDAWGINYGYNAAYAFPWNPYAASSISRGSDLYLILERLGKQPAGNTDWNWYVNAPWTTAPWLPGQPFVDPGQQRFSHRGRSNCLYVDMHVASEAPVRTAAQRPNPWLGL